MRVERTKNAVKGIIAGLIFKVFQMIVPFIMRTAMIYIMGVQYVGLNSLFYSILQVLNLAELGVSNAMVYSMYKPIAEDDEKTICALMRLYRKYYRIIGLVIGVAGLILTPMVPNLISGEIPTDINIYILYFLNLGSTVLTYWLFAYKNCLLQAHQRTDIISVVGITTNIVQYGIQLLVLVLYRNYYLYVAVLIITQVLNNIVTALAVNKTYPHYHPKGSLDEVSVSIINGEIKDIFTAKLGGVILTSADTIVISAFLGLRMLAIYQNYYFIMKSVFGVIEVILSSIVAGLGNSFVIETKQKNYNDLCKFTFMFMWLIGTCSCCFIGLYQPFMELWVGENLMLSFGIVVCLSIFFVVYTMNRWLSIYKDAAGLWHKDRFRPLVTALINLGLNLLLVQICGIYGIILSTVFSMTFVGIPWILHNIFTVLFDYSFSGKYVKQILNFTIAIIISGITTTAICTRIDIGKWSTLFVCFAVCVVVPNIIFLFFYSKTVLFRQSIQLADRVTKNKLLLEKRIFYKA